MDGLENGRRFAIARGLAKRGLVAFLAFAMAFGTTPTQMWADGVEGIAEAATEATGSVSSSVDEANSDNAAGDAAKEEVATVAADTASDAPAAEQQDSTAEKTTSEKTVSSNAVQASTESGSSAVAENKKVTASVSVIGVDAQGNQQTWAPAQSISLDEGATAADLSEELFKRTGLKADYDPDGSLGWVLNSITSPFDAGQKLAYNTNGDYKYWQLFVDGTSSQLGAGGVTLKDGMSVVWCYSGYMDPAPTNDLSVTCEVIGEDADGDQQTWAQPTTLTVKDGETAADLSEKLFKQAGITADYSTSQYGWYLSSITSPFDSNLNLSSKEVSENIWSYWQLFVNGKYSDLGAGAVKLKAGDKVSWVYGSNGTMPDQISVSMEVIATDNDAKPVRWTEASNQTFFAGTSIYEASKSYLTSCGMHPKFLNTGDGWTLFSMSSPSDPKDVKSLSWKCFVNGVPEDQLPDAYELKSGDKLTWAFDAGDTVPDPDEVIVIPDASRPSDWKADWNGSSNALTDASTPKGNVADAWTFDWKAYSGAQYPNASEPIVVNDYVYLAVNKRLLKIDADTGKVLSASNLQGSIGYTTRPVYAKGLILVPLDGGAVQALTADKLETVWITDSIGALTQSNSTITVKGNYAYVGTVDVDYGKGLYNNGHLTCINLSTGAIAWQHVNADEGYYWTGATAAMIGEGDDAKDALLIPTSAGTVELISRSTGQVADSLKLGTLVNSSIVDGNDGSTFYVVSRDGKLHVLDVDASSLKLSEKKSVDLGLTGSACLPTVVGNKMIIGGEKGSSSALAVIDLDTLKATLVSTADGAALPSGGIKGAPLVSMQNGSTYVYFTVNYGETSDYTSFTAGGGVYRFRLGDSEASLVYDAVGHNNYCDSPVACGKDGSLYYINDSGTLFCLRSGVSVSFDANGGSPTGSSSVYKGNKLAKPADPTRAGYTFGGWFTDAACTKAYDFSKAVTEAFTLYAKWTKIASKPAVNPEIEVTVKANPKTEGLPVNKPTGKVAPSSNPVSTKQTVSNASDDKNGSSKASASEKTSSSKKATSSTESTSAKTAKATGAVATQGSSMNPLAVVGVVAGVIGLILIVVFLSKKRGGEE